MSQQTDDTWKLHTRNMLSLSSYSNTKLKDFSKVIGLFSTWKSTSENIPEEDYSITNRQEQRFYFIFYSTYMKEDISSQITAMIWCSV